ncbi:hypothetical protein JCM10207_008088 [Rhodosporidiobolus poonsookiae]
MNPNDLFLRSHAAAQQQQQQQAAAAAQQAQQQQASTSAPAGLNGAPQAALPGTDGATYRARRDAEQDKKDLELAQLLDMMDDYKPIIPDEVTDFYLQRAGFDTNDVRVKRLLALAAQRFVSSISADAFQYARARTAAGPGGRTGGATAGGAAAGAGKDQPAKKGRQRTVLTMEDLSAALKEYGVDASRAPYYL